MGIVSWTFVVLCSNVYLSSANNGILSLLPDPASIMRLAAKLSAGMETGGDSTSALTDIFSSLTVNNPLLGIFSPACTIERPGCPNKNVLFWLYDSESPDTPVLLDPLNLDPANIRLGRKVKIILHGYSGDANYTPNSEIRPVLLATQDVYVISVDYGPLVREPCYFAGARNIGVAAECLAQLINNLVEGQHVYNEDIHIIGFSLGGQMAGLTANLLKRRLTRITGLDPAKPMFTGVDNDHKLDPSDADVVDVIHADPLARGLLQPHGHIDFYPNMFSQPGCEQPDVNGASSCNHERAAIYYAESISTPSGFWGYYCPSWAHKVFGFCDDKQRALMGYHVDERLRGSYFLSTRSEAPFALGPMPPSELDTKFAETIQNAGITSTDLAVLSKIDF